MAAAVQTSPDARGSDANNFVARVTALPVVVEAYTLAANAVNALAENNKYAKYAVDSTNNAVRSAASTASVYAAPYQERFAPQIAKADETCSKVLDIVERKFPAITQPPAELVSTARASVSQVKSQVAGSAPVTTATNAIKNLESTLASAMDTVEVTVQKYLPEDEKASETVKKVGAEGQGQIKRAVNITWDVQRRLANKVVAQVRHLQETIPEATQQLLKLKESSHLIQSATDSLRALNEKLSQAIGYCQENANFLKESGVERAKAIDAQYEIRDRVEPVIKAYLTEISALTNYIQAHVALGAKKGEDVVEEVAATATTATAPAN